MTSDNEHVSSGTSFRIALLKQCSEEQLTSPSTFPTKEISLLQTVLVITGDEDNNARGPVNQQPEKHSTKLADILVGISAGLSSPLIKFH
jgi:hypothetical protein